MDSQNLETGNDAQEDMNPILQLVFSIVTSKLFIINIVITSSLLMLAQKAIQPLKQLNEEHRLRDKKYAIF
jgi:hypothetical protein